MFISLKTINIIGMKRLLVHINVAVKGKSSHQSLPGCKTVVNYVLVQAYRTSNHHWLLSVSKCIKQ